MSFLRKSFSPKSFFPPVWFAEADDSHLLPEERGAATPSSPRSRPVIYSVPHSEPDKPRTKSSRAVATLLDLGKDEGDVEIIDPAATLQAVAPIPAGEMAAEMSAALRRIKAQADHAAQVLEMVSQQEADDAAAMMLMLEMMD